MQCTWTQHTTYTPMPQGVVYTVFRLVGTAWVGILQSTDYMKCLAFVVNHRRTRPPEDKVKIGINNKTLFV